MELTADIVAALRHAAAEQGLPRLDAVSLDHPGFAPARRALDEHLDLGRHGEMDFMARSREARKDPRAMMPAARSAIVVLAPYDGEPGPVARYAQATDYHTCLHARLEPLVAVLAARLPGVEATICVDTKPLLERTAAALAGLGFLGKNGCLIAPGLGSYVLLGALLTSAEIPVPAAFSPARAIWEACGACTRCLDACPTQAFVEPGVLDPRRCISYLTIEHRGPIPSDLADAMGERVAGCDVCQEVCPYNASRHRGARAGPQPWQPPLPRPLHPVELAEVASLGSSRYRAWVKASALRRIPRRSLRRNALLALGNRVSWTQEDRHAVARAREDDDPLVRAAAERAWARHAAG